MRLGLLRKKKTISDYSKTVTLYENPFHPLFSAVLIDNQNGNPAYELPKHECLQRITDKDNWGSVSKSQISKKHCRIQGVRRVFVTRDLTPYHLQTGCKLFLFLP